MDVESGELKDRRDSVGDGGRISVGDDGDSKSIEDGEEPLGDDNLPPVASVIPTSASITSPKVNVNEKDDSDGELMEEGEEPNSLDGGTGNGGQRENSQEKEHETPKPRPLHKTCSIFFRNLAPSITKQEIEDVSFLFVYLFSDLNYNFSFISNRNVANFQAFFGWQSQSHKWIGVSIVVAGQLMNVQ